MKKMYKLVTQDWTTHRGMKWEIGKTNKATVSGNQMCTNQVLHCYSDPRLAVLFNPIHADIPNPILLEISCSEIVASDGLKYACKQQTPLRQIEVPKLTVTQRVAFAIKCALVIYKAVDFIKWAESWLNGTDRTADAAYAAARAAAYAARAAARAADAADAAASAAAYAARAAASAAAYAAYAARAADAADAAAYTADAAARAAAYAAPNFIEIIQWVIDNIEG